MNVTPGASLWKGLLLGSLLNVVMLIASIAGIAIGGIGGYLLLGFGVVQGTWMWVFYYIFRKQGAAETAKGILIVAGLTFLLWSACVGALFGGWVRIGG